MGLGCGEGLDSAPIGDACTVVNYCFRHAVVCICICICVGVVGVVDGVHVVNIVVVIHIETITGVEVNVEEVEMICGRIGCEL